MKYMLLIRHDEQSEEVESVGERKRLLTGGPFAGSRERLGGYFMIFAKDREQAMDIAARIPPARWGRIEIRPLAETA